MKVIGYGSSISTSSKWVQPLDARCHLSYGLKRYVAILCMLPLLSFRGSLNTYTSTRPNLRRFVTPWVHILHVLKTWINIILFLTLSPRLAFPPSSLCILCSSQSCIILMFEIFWLDFFDTPPPGMRTGSANSKRPLMYTKTHIQKLSLFLGGHRWTSMFVGDVVGANENMK